MTIEITTPDEETADVFAPPPLILLASLGIGLSADRVMGLTFEGWVLPRIILGGALVAGAIVLGLAGLTRFRRAGTAVEPWHPSTQLVTDGVFARTRNPMYVALVMLQLGIGFAFGGPVTLLLVIPLAMILHSGVVLAEERYLDRKFGAPYRAYRDRVRRYL
ncbi:methyltransferase family protein [Acuticoccus sediminis]|uniref:methyltransferase family protein n=1 Tax=Acuticoccus sediminis TaxID=2184697 RepID=UPI001CFF403B|nr:isoprenylcysteine carboxylmethyltransferase family protein [Acuticoccus sediminis]